MITKEEFESAVARSDSRRETLVALGLSSTGASYVMFNKLLSRHGTDISHFHSKKRYNPRGKIKWDLHSTFIKHQDINSSPAQSNLRKAVVRYGVIKYTCAVCDLSDWRGVPLSLQLDHVDGDKLNCTIGNLRWLCPNCHSQTETWGSKRGFGAVKHFCRTCGSKIGRTKYGSCVKCYMGVSKTSESVPPIIVKESRRDSSKAKSGNRRTKIDWPSIDELAALVKSMPMTKLATRLGVSTTTIKNRCRKLDVYVPTRKYHW